MYKAMWHGTAVAAKILKNASAIALGDFRSEIEVLRKVHHPNAVQFLGAPWAVGGCSPCGVLFLQKRFGNMGRQSFSVCDPLILILGGDVGRAWRMASGEGKHASTPAASDGTL